MKTIVFMGEYGSGKSFISEEIYNILNDSNIDVKKIRFAYPIEYIFSDIYSLRNSDTTIKYIDINRYIDRFHKYTNNLYSDYDYSLLKRYHYNIDPRYMIKYFAQRMKDIINKNIWIEISTNDITPQEYLIVEDMRFIEELNYIKNISDDIMFFVIFKNSNYKVDFKYDERYILKNSKNIHYIYNSFDYKPISKIYSMI